MERTNVIDMQGIVKRYYEGEPNELEILHGIDLKVFQGEFVSIVGESGSGKSTLMNMIGALDRPTEGQYFLGGRDISKLQDEELSDIRNQEIGFVFQNFCLIPRMSAVRNVEIPLMYANMPPKQRRERAMELLALVGMEERADHKPNELSGGQNQRVAMNRRERWIPRPDIWSWIFFTSCMKSRIRRSCSLRTVRNWHMKQSG